MIDNLAVTISDSLTVLLPNLIISLINGLIVLIVALIVLIVGWLVAIGVGQLVTRILDLVKLNQHFENAGLKKALDKAEIKANASGFIGDVFKWIIFIIVLMVIAEVLGLGQFAGLLRGVLGYLPNVLVAVFLFVAAVIVSEILEKVIRAAVESTKVGYGAMAGTIVKWSIWIFALLIILEQLGIAPTFIQTLYTGVIAFLVIAFGLAFGLGGKEVAGDILADLKKKLLG